jgi:hypothetical protein
MLKPIGLTMLTATLLCGQSITLAPGSQTPAAATQMQCVAGQANQPYCCQLAEKGTIPQWENYPNSMFLTKRTGTEQGAKEYYALVDPNNQRTTLAGFWKANGWNPDGSAADEARTIFLNNNDLGLGSDLHCRPNNIQPSSFGTVDISCYVTNYGQPNQNIVGLDDAVQAAQTGNTSKAKRTVGIEFRAQTGLIAFFAYRAVSMPSQGSATRNISVDFDGFGPKFVPGICTNCHGGNYFPGTANVGASFLAADLSTFRYSSQQGYTRGDQERNFKQQNIDALAANCVVCDFRVDLWVVWK